MAVFPAWLVYFVAADSLFRTRPARGYFLGWAASTVLTTAVLLAAVSLLRAPFFLLLLAPAMVPLFLWVGLYGHWLRARSDTILVPAAYHGVSNLVMQVMLESLRT